MPHKFRFALFAAAMAGASTFACGSQGTQNPVGATTTSGSSTTAGAGGAAGTSSTSAASSTTAASGTGGTSGTSVTSATSGTAGSGGAPGGASGAGGASSTGGASGGGGTPDASTDGGMAQDGSTDAPGPSDASVDAAAFDRAAVIAIMKKVAANQLAENPPATTVNDWINAAFYTGLMAAWRATGDTSMHDAARAWSVAHAWDLHMRVPANLTHGDDQCCTQTYSELYLEAPMQSNAFMYQKMQAVADSMMANPMAGRVWWWWCDALFMAPPAFARIGAATGQTKYFDFMNTLYWDSKTFLFVPARGLFYRDMTYFNTNVYWARGNGWVLAGIARILDYLPANNARRNEFVQLMSTMAAALVPLQQSDGLWRADLLNPTRFPQPETSGTGFFTFGLAWGIHHGVLPRETYLPVVRKAWDALVGTVAADGRMQWVQPTNKEPAATLQTDHLPYGAGAFLLAGSEVLAL